MTGILVAGLLAGFGIAVQVGAITVLIMTLSAHHSLRTGLAAGLGTATADGIFCTLAVTVGAGLAGVLRPIADPLRMIAAAVLLLIAARGLLSALRARRPKLAKPESAHPLTDSPSIGDSPDPTARADQDPNPATAPRRPLGAYFQVLGLTLLNPLTIVYFSVLVLGLHRGQTWSVADGVVFVCATFIASACWQSVLALGGAVIGRALTGPRGRLVTALVGNAVIALLAVHLLVS